MLSKKMYALLSCLPRNHEPISYYELAKKCSLSKDEMNECFLEIDFMSRPYYRTGSNARWQENTFYISELGLAEVEAYEREQENQSIVNKSLQIAQESLKVAIVAKWAAIASSAVAVLSLIKMFF